MGKPLNGGKGDLNGKPEEILESDDLEMFRILDKYCTRNKMVILKRREGQFTERSVLLWKKKPRT